MLCGYDLRFPVDINLKALNKERWKLNGKTAEVHLWIESGNKDIPFVKPFLVCRTLPRSYTSYSVISKIHKSVVNFNKVI